MATQFPILQAEKRSALGSRSVSRLRQQGKLPAVIYGHKQDPQTVSLDPKATSLLLRQHAHIVEVQHDGTSEPCLFKEVQWDHLGTTMIHIDFARVDLTEEITVEIGIRLVGEPAGLKEEGAYLEQQLTELEIKCLAVNIPAEIVAKVDHLNVDEVLEVKDLVLPEGVKAVTDPDTIVAAVRIAKALEEEPTAVPAEGAAAEPEVIGKKEEGEEGEAAAEEKK
ncbi:MAG: 50S ribosomal protein L25 [Phycisphaeraceae bacterium]|nr:50S ribosomal protein L25 [Phycisphaeraceae bacterium]